MRLLFALSMLAFTTSLSASALPGIPDGKYEGQGWLTPQGYDTIGYLAKLNLKGDTMEASYEYGEDLYDYYKVKVVMTSDTTFDLVEKHKVIGNGECKDQV